MIIDFSAGASRRHHVALGAFIWGFSFSAFGAVTPPAVRAKLVGYMTNLGKLGSRTETP